MAQNAPLLTRTRTQNMKVKSGSCLFVKCFDFKNMARLIVFLIFEMCSTKNKVWFQWCPHNICIIFIIIWEQLETCLMKKQMQYTTHEKNNHTCRFYEYNTCFYTHNIRHVFTHIQNTCST